MFSFFKKNYSVGVDLGTSSIKVVELTLRNGRPFLVNYGSVSLDFGDISSGLAGGLSFESRRRSYFIALLKKMNIKNPESIYISMPGFSGLVSLVEFPEMNEKDLAQAIQFEAHKYVPMEMDEVALSWDIVKREHQTEAQKSQEKKSGKIEVLLVAALKKDIEQIGGLFKATSFKLKAIELETFSIARALVGDDLGTYLIIDIGFKVCNFVLVHKGIVRANRNIDVGGNEITNTISESMNITFDRAEQLKKSGRDLFHRNELSILFPSLDLAVSEAQRVIAAFGERNKQVSVGKVFLSGGSSGLKGVDKFFTDKLGIPCEVGNPWSRIDYDASLSPHLARMGGAYSVAIGLALRGIEEYQRT